MSIEASRPLEPTPPPAPRLVHLAACPVCSHGVTAFSFASVDLTYGLPGLFTYERCASCGSVFQNPRAVDDDLALCYPAAYFTHDGTVGPRLSGSDGGAQAFLRRLVLGAGRGRASSVRRLGGRVLRAIAPLRRRAMFGLVEELGPPVGATRCLELGPGTGDDMWRLAQVGWTVTGLDLDPQAAEVATARSGCPVVVGDILEHRPVVPYDLVYGSHSIEHVPNLRETIVHLRSLLAEGGRLVVIVPNATSVSARLFGPLSVVWDPPRHLSLPSIEALAALLRDAGFSDVKVRTSPNRAAHYCAIARARRTGMTGTAAWAAPITRADRLLHTAEGLLVRLGFGVGEEIVASASAKVNQGGS